MAGLLKFDFKPQAKAVVAEQPKADVPEQPEAVVAEQSKQRGRKRTYSAVGVVVIVVVVVVVIEVVVVVVIIIMSGGCSKSGGVWQTRGSSCVFASEIYIYLSGWNGFARNRITQKQ